jgi:hypothetical protein
VQHTALICPACRACRAQVSWCKLEVALASPKAVVCDLSPYGPSMTDRPAPRVTVASLSLKTVINPGTQQHEVPFVAFMAVAFSVCNSVIGQEW